MEFETRSQTQSLLLIGFASAVFALPQCAHDSVQDGPVVCGDGLVIGSEECDNDTAGCSDCKIVTGWDCVDNFCSEICGDELIVGEEQCDPPDQRACDNSCRGAVKPEACDMTGYWVARQTDFSRDSVLGALQVSSTWYAYRFDQGSGGEFEVKQSLNCGIEASGSATVRPLVAGYEWLMYSDPADGSTRHGVRRGTFTESGDGQCSFAMDRWYVARGLEDRFLPPDFSAHPRLADLQPLPFEENPLVPTGEFLDGVIDVDKDGFPGWAWQVSGNFAGIRHVVARDWNQYSTVPELPIATHSVEFTTRATFNTEESLLALDQCDPSCALFLAGSAPALDQPARATFRHLGASLEEPRVAELITGPLGDDVTVDMATCAKVRSALPHVDWLEGGKP